jgi:hypothetical protein
MLLKERFEIRVSLEKLLIGLLLTAVPVCIAGLYSLTQSHKSMERSVGNQFRIIAEITAAATSQFIQDRVVEVAMIAAEPAIVEAVVAGNRSYEGMSETAIAARIERIDKIWNTPASDPITKPILSAEASRLLRRHHELDPRILRITVTDAKGAVVAASHKTLDYYQADEDYWQNIYAQGRGAISLTDILYDEAIKAYYIGVGAPMIEAASNQFIGSVDALVDVTTLFPIVNRAGLGSTGRTMLVKDDGTVISAPRANLAMKLKAPEFLAVQDALGTLRGRETGYVIAGVPGGGSNVIGFADTGLKRDFQNLGWIILVCQDTADAFAAVNTVGRLFALMSLVGLVAVIFLAVYFSLHRREVFTEIGELRTGARAGKTGLSATSEEQVGNAAYNSNGSAGIYANEGKEER